MIKYHPWYFIILKFISMQHRFKLPPSNLHPCRNVFIGEYMNGNMSKEEKKEYEAGIEKEIENEIEERLERRFGGGCGGDMGWWDDRSLPVKIVMGFGFAILGIGLGALVILVVMLLWNWLMPEIFGLTELTYWKAGGLLLLSSILFKRVRFGDGDGRNERRRKRELKRYMHD